MAACLMLGAVWNVSAQTQPATAAPAAESAKAAAAGVQSANIFSIAPDANTDPKYADQN
ncbi:MAG: formate dehydrogenase subunit gamma, partial [Betaproteobacteria bacterium]|nr:formate dehydrogenase subunit gamma [Betaproteobacteria bacterium]NDE24870.1 formate dehydrogenase subunit gamma [Betaproteobacteria bacterium]